MLEETLQSFVDSALITDVLYQLKSGKEATVWVCRGASGLLAAKVYKPRASRSFHNDAAYVAGRVIVPTRVARAVARGTRFGHEVAHGLWLAHEYETLSTLYRAGVDVPEPIAMAEGATLMSFVALGDDPAPQLREAPMDAGRARSVLDRLLENVELMLANDVIHADLSPFNVLLGDAGVTIIDFPQAVDPRFNPNARELLFRDVENVCRWAGKWGIDADGFALADDLWTRWERALL
jgi:RIO kinase 1